MNDAYIFHETLGFGESIGLGVSNTNPKIIGNDRTSGYFILALYINTPVALVARNRMVLMHSAGIHPSLEKHLGKERIPTPTTSDRSTNTS
mmetsp:Transcript_6377/g.11525  ORF Transcript_6377/g.11525 Transcript_6377/m.11525 type:complete len:91 (-) Transcript_6377:411-683(-)